MGIYAFGVKKNRYLTREFVFNKNIQIYTFLSLVWLESVIIKITIDRFAQLRLLA